MPKAQRSGITVTPDDVPKILAMIARGDRKHDIAAWFGLNQGRIAEVEDGHHGVPPLADDNEIPPAGSPGLKAKELRVTLENVQALLSNGQIAQAKEVLQNGIKEFDKNE
jgi:hypothetical protein